MRHRSDPGGWSPKHQVSADLAFNLPQFKNVTVRGIYTHMVRGDPFDLSSVDIKGRDGQGAGAGVTVSPHTGDPNTSIGLVTEVYAYRNPFTNGDGSGTAITPGFALGALPRIGVAVCVLRWDHHSKHTDDRSERRG